MPASGQYLTQVIPQCVCIAQQKQYLTQTVPKCICTFYDKTIPDTKINNPYMYLIIVMYIQSKLQETDVKTGYGPAVKENRQTDPTAVYLS